MLTLRIILGFLVLSVVCSLSISDKQTVASAVPDNEVINVYLIPHSHDDVGWLKNPNDYFFGGSQEIQWAGVQYTLDNVVTEISVHDSLKFSVVEIAFLDMWWRSANQSMKDLMVGQVKGGRIQFLNAGWCMSDQAAIYYEDSIDQMTLGLQWVKKNFDVVPNVAWQIDPFGHQASFANLGHQMGFNAMFFARLHYQDKIVRSSRKALQLYWNPPQTSGNQDPIFTHVNFQMYTPPSGFCFDKTCSDEPIKTDPTMEGHNLNVKSEAFVNYFKNMSKFYQSNNLMHTLGGDFHWSNARMWTLNIDRLIKQINNKPEYGMNVRYATPGQYLAAIYKQNLTYPEKTDDFFPYADYPEGYWSGYFTSRVSLKGFVRDTGRWLQAIRTNMALLIMSNRSSYLNSHLDDFQNAVMAMEKKMGVLQHHDAVSGTSKQKVADWYIQTACIAKSQLTSFYDNIIKEQAGSIIGEGSEQVFQTHWNSTQSQWGISKALSNGKKVLVQLYNPGPQGIYPIKIKLDSRNLNIMGTDNKPIKGDLICGNNKDSSDCQLFFQLEFPETSWAYVKLDPLNSQGSVNIIALKQLSIITASKQIKLSSTASLKIHRKQEKFELTIPSGTYPFELTYSHYIGFSDVGQKSGAYIFRPSASTINNPKKYSTLKSLHYAEGDQMVVVALQGDNTYTNLYFNKREGHVEAFGVEIETFIDSININDKEGKQIVLQITTNLNNNKTFYTDSNGLEEQRRVLDIMPTWELVVTQPVAGNYYPLNSHIKIKDSGKTVSVLVDRARGGSVIKNGIIELMIHRRLLEDDVRGVWEPLNETEPGGKGLTQKVRNYLLIGQNNRQVQKRLDQAIQITWSNSESSSFTKFAPESPVLTVPKQTKLWLRYAPDGTYLLRVQLIDNLLTNSSTVQIAGDWALSQMTLGANQLLSEWTQKQYRWRGQKSSILNTTTSPKHSKNVTRRLMKQGSVGSASQIQLKALQIRTFRLSKT